MSALGTNGLSENYLKKQRRKGEDADAYVWKLGKEIP